VLVGGPYFLISRNLGRSIGGAIGFLFYIGTTLAASMYTLGAVEAFQTGFRISRFSGDTQIQALLLITLLAGIVAVGVKYVNMSALVFLFIVFLSVFSFGIGGLLFANDSFDGQLPASARVSGDNMNSNFQPDPETGITPSFFSLLALFYPSVTGIMAGSNRSGVLKSPGTSIPVGTISAVLLTASIYLGTIWLFGTSLSNKTLMSDKMVVAKLAYPAEIIVNLGIIMSCVGAGLQSLTGAPQLLAAMAADETIPFIMPFKATKDEHGNNKFTRAVGMTWAIGALPCLAGNLDFITAPLTMCFLMMYAEA
jgi:potassium/chloride transporter 4/5/6